MIGHPTLFRYDRCMSPRPPLPIGASYSVTVEGRVGKSWRGAEAIKDAGEARKVLQWRARTRLGTPAGTHSVEAVGHSAAEAKRRLQERLEVLRAQTGSRSDATVAEAIEAWLARIEEEARKAPGTLATYRGAGELVLGHALGRHRLADLTPTAVSDFLREQHEARPGRVRTIRVVLAGSVDLAIAVGWVAGTNPVKAAIHFVRDKPEPGELSEEQLAVLIALARQQDKKPRTLGVIADTLLIMAGTGVRPGEVFALRKRDWDSSRRRLTISGTVRDSPAIHRQAKTKTKSGWRVLVVPTFVAEILDALSDNAEDPDSLLLRGRADMVSPNNFRRALRGMLSGSALAELPDLTPKALRRVVASTLARADVVAAAAQLGHEGLGTLSSYTAARPVSDNAELLASVDPEASAKSAAWGEIQRIAGAHSLALNSTTPANKRGLAGWRATLLVQPNWDLEEVLFEAALASFANEVHLLRDQYPLLRPRIVGDTGPAF